ncbi:uncharacterized protein RSE6_13878 [Rhynchosporium secalis]|uniref:Uncharacterized protein n=1 Tax=Rhynchosporium secalis TaxID=38038 RepID=A0A1E1MTY0_RHYSE|nr:uncharacterized protein RSE6_13878 [Rhynchosporium secalis]
MSPIDHAGDYGVGQSSTISVRNFICTSLYRSQLALDKILDGSGATMKLVMPCISNRAIAFHEGELDRVPMFRPFFGFIQSSSTKSDVQSELSSGFDESVPVFFITTIYTLSTAIELFSIARGFRGPRKST